MVALGMPVAGNNALVSMGDGECCCQLHPLQLLPLLHALSC